MKDLYALWLIPSIDTGNLLQKTITDLSKKFNSPILEPHVTLLGNISCDLDTVMQKTETLVSKLKSFPIYLDEITFGTTYFQSIFIKVKTTEPLVNANLIAKEIFQTEDKKFMPHLSLIYSNHTIEERKKIASEIMLPKDITFTVEKIVITPFTDDPQEFTHIAEFQLKQ